MFTWPGGLDMAMATVVLLLLVWSLLVLSFATRLGPGMGRETWRALFWTSGVLTGLGFLAALVVGGYLRALLGIPFAFAICVLGLLPFFCLGDWLRRRRRQRRLTDRPPPPENPGEQQD